MRKQAVIIGKGQSLLSKQLGPTIDAFDLIIRVNHMPVEKLIPHIGKKTDIFSNRQKEDRKSTRLNSSHVSESRMPSSA